MTARFFAPEALASDGIVQLSDEEANHLTRVLRLHAGAAVQVFDGRGREFDAVVLEALKSGVTLRLGTERQATAEPRVAVTLAQAVLKGDKMDQLVRDAVMIGAAAIQPIVTGRTEVSRAALMRGSRRERWQRIAVASAKQCGRAVVPAVGDPIDAHALFSALHASGERPLLFAEPSAGTAGRLSDLDPVPPSAVTLIVGPEGGWTSDELQHAAGVRFITLNGPTLRADAMALVAIAALFAHWREY
jgi:16S rRNA (uracil1498-N3)-methyltransferase